MIILFQCRDPSVEALFRATHEIEPVFGVNIDASLGGYLAGRMTRERDEPFPIVRIALPPRFGKGILRRTQERLAVIRGPAEKELAQKARVAVFVMPHFASLAAKLSDLTRVYIAIDNYESWWNQRFVRRAEAWMCRNVEHVICTSEELRDRICDLYNFPRARCHVLPNAASVTSLVEAPLSEPRPLPEEAAHLKRPVAGVIGMIDSLRINMDLVDAVAERCPWLSWVFVGSRRLQSRHARIVYEKLKSRTDRFCFVNRVPYDQVRRFTQSFDVALMPYRTDYPMHAFGSPVRLYEAFAATRPILSTSAYPQVLKFQPAVRIANTPDETVAALNHLRDRNFDDGMAEERWRLSMENTYAVRARQFLEIVGPREGKE